jgi:UDP-N-acetylmuramoylalanine--D-glutamate ligase
LKVRLAGNIGRPLLAFDPDSESVDWWVVELSSYQLADLKGHAAVGVLLNLDQDHLDWHGGVDSYYQDKLNLVGLLRAGDVLIANHADSILRERLINLDHEMAVTWFNNAGGFRIQNGEILEGGEALAVASTEALPGSLPGPHNLANLAAALTVLKTLDVDPINAVRAAASYKGLPHRLQLVGQRDGVRYVNDSIASAPLATVAAVEAFPDIRATLIVGGMDRGVDWSPHIKAIARMRPAGIIGMPDNGQSLLTMFSESGLVPEETLYNAANLEEAVQQAQRITAAHGLVLLSPGAPSFPYFRNFQERGRAFAQYCGFDLPDSEADFDGQAEPKELTE